MGYFNVKRIYNNKHFILLLLIALSLPLSIWSVHLFDWDEVNFAEIAREMLISKSYFTIQLNYQTFWEKPPLFFWLQSFCMYLFGTNEFASRFPNTLVGIATLITLYYFGKKIINKNFGIIWVLMFMGSLLPYFYFKTAIIDPLFNLFIFLALINLYLYENKKAIQNIIWAAVFSGLAVLTKGPVALIIIGLTIMLLALFKKDKISLNIPHRILFVIIVLGITSIWIIPEMIAGGGITLFKEFIAYQIRLFTQSEAGHGQPFYYHFIVLFFGCFPISQIALPIILKINPKNIWNEKDKKDFYKLNFILFWVVLILFSLTTTKIVHYSSMCYFPLSFIAASWVYYLIKENKLLLRFQWWLIFIIGILFQIIFISLPLIIHFKNKIIPYIKDSFAVENIKFNVVWNTTLIVIIGLILLSIFIFIILKIKKEIKNIFLLGIFNIVLLITILSIVVPKLERHIQGAMIDFFIAHKDTHKYYVTTYGFKSYAQFFYTKKQIQANTNAYNLSWLLEGKIDKPVFIVCKIFDKENVFKLHNIEFLYESGGFAFFKRSP